MNRGSGEVPQPTRESRIQLTRVHRILIGVVVAGAVIIAGIGFAGSYVAVRELALQKGFGNFAYVFPIGIDAGICVLLALDLLLTWIRIPFPLLRQTAWLLTAGTVAFNGASAWPDPLGVGMHAVIPVLFIVAVEAARHAIGRIADITADKHMEGVRLTRWLLSPVPTFLLWRRMKLWELRSYEQVIKLEQERLVYQTSLRSRFGKAWRRKAPVEALMPLRLARYGIPLAETAPAGLAAAGIAELPILFTVERVSAPAQPEDSAVEEMPDQEPEAEELGSADQVQARVPAPRQAGEPVGSVGEDAEPFAEAYQAFITQFQVEPTSAQWALWLRDAYGITTGVGGPLSEEQVQPLLLVLQERYGVRAEEPVAADELQATGQPADQWYDYFYSAWSAYAEEYGTYPDAAALAAYLYERDAITGDGGRPITGDDLAAFVVSFQEREAAAEPSVGEAGNPGEPVAEAPLAREEAPEEAFAGAGTQAAKEGRSPGVSASIDDHSTTGLESSAGERAVLTTVDRYYLAWSQFQTEHGDEPTDEQLSVHLAAQGMHGRGGKPVSPATLRRYLLPFRVYNVWAEHRMRNDNPDAGAVAQECAVRGITGQYNKPVTAEYVTASVDDFDRRGQALARHHVEAQQ
ncbi:DUF2637 domain-containing protein [Streptomyces sp. NBC_00989]|uniref:DUF2637 domain-containing protein n=1 Tax=Streptomyces sp. NBC_00989 TaxID=2903705 RepID=UPI00387050C3|nr:DUF2637 domain-containing protein [Streptomyces sp. NBC_00989]